MQDSARAGDAFLVYAAATRQGWEIFMRSTFLQQIASLLVVSASACAQTPPTTPEPPKQIVEQAEMEGGYRFTVETTEAPDLTDWAHRELVPALQKWYPLIVQMLPSEGFSAPKTFSVTFTERYKGVAATSGNRIEGAPGWYRGQLKGEAVGSMVHELVHVAQQYGRARRPDAERPPGWLIEGIPDYIRWYLFEPQSKGCEISPKRAASARYDGSYRVSANFLNYVVGKYDKDIFKELNSAMREGRYTGEIWKTRTGHSVEELAEEWKKFLEAGSPPSP